MRQTWLAAIPDHVEALGALVVFAACTAVSMSVASTTFGYAITRGPVLSRFLAVAPALGAISLAFGAWYALGAPRGTPAPVIERLNTEVNAALADPAFAAQLAELGGILMPGTPADLGALIAADTEKIGKVIRAANITIE